MSTEAPRKRFQMVFRIHSHSAEEMANEMHDFATQLLIGEVGPIGEGWSSSGYHYEITENPRQNEKRYKAELDDYLKESVDD